MAAVVNPTHVTEPRVKISTIAASVTDKLNTVRRSRQEPTQAIARATKFSVTTPRTVSQPMKWRAAGANGGLRRLLRDIKRPAVHDVGRLHKVHNWVGPHVKGAIRESVAVDSDEARGKTGEQDVAGDGRMRLRHDGLFAARCGSGGGGTTIPPLPAYSNALEPQKSQKFRRPARRWASWREHLSDRVARRFATGKRR